MTHMYFTAVDIWNWQLDSTGSNYSPFMQGYGSGYGHLDPKSRSKKYLQFNSQRLISKLLPEQKSKVIL